MSEACIATVETLRVGSGSARIRYDRRLASSAGNRMDADLAPIEQRLEHQNRQVVAAISIGNDTDFGIAFGFRY